MFIQKKHLVDELQHLEYVFEQYNNFPKWVTDQLLSKVQSEKFYNVTSSIQENQCDANKIVHLLVLLYTGSKGKKPTKLMENGLKCVLFESITTRKTMKLVKLRWVMTHGSHEN